MGFRFARTALRLTRPLRVRTAAAMSSDDIARMRALVNKADELFDKGHIVRCAEYFGRAAEATRALGADNLVTASLLVQQAHLMAVYALSRSGPRGEPTSAHSALRAESVSLFAAAVATLERRRVAGTLLEGKCAAAEEDWCACDLRSCDPHLADAAVRSRAPLFGYETFVDAAMNVMDVLEWARLFAGECSEAQLRCFAETVVQAAKLMQQPRRYNGVLRAEALFVRMLRLTAAKAGANGLSARLVQLLERTSQQLQRSGELEVHHIEEGIRSLEPERHALLSTLDKSLNAPGLRSCALRGCGAREAHPAHFKSCAACKGVVSCSKEHQAADWPATRRRARRRARRKRLHCALWTWRGRAWPLHTSAISRRMPPSPRG